MPSSPCALASSSRRHASSALSRHHCALSSLHPLASSPHLLVSSHPVAIVCHAAGDGGCSALAVSGSAWCFAIAIHIMRLGAWTMVVGGATGALQSSWGKCLGRWWVAACGGLLICVMRLCATPEPLGLVDGVVGGCSWCPPPPLTAVVVAVARCHLLVGRGPITHKLGI